MGVLAALVMLSVLGCETIGFYGQAVSGQLNVLTSRKPVERLLADPELDERLRTRLELSQRILSFAEEELTLTVGGRYRTFVQLERSSVVWNVFAAPAFELTPVRWCYPFVGCAAYRGYFREAAARRKASRLEAQGFEVFVGGVDAYSTLGWFNDPLLSTFIYRSDAALAELLLHELAHSRVWVKGDVTFNESFATFVGETGARRWLLAQGAENADRRYQAANAEWLRVRRFLLLWRDALAAVYGTADSDEATLASEKAQVMAVFNACYGRLKERLGRGRYDSVMRSVNNARLAAIGTYTDHVAAFAVLFEDEGRSWPRFFEAVQTIGSLAAPERRARLDELLARAPGPQAASGEEPVAGRADEHGAEEIQCEALPSHGLDRELTGTEHDQIGGRGDGQHEGA